MVHSLMRQHNSTPNYCSIALEGVYSVYMYRLNALSRLIASKLLKPLGPASIHIIPQLFTFLAVWPQARPNWPGMRHDWVSHAGRQLVAMVLLSNVSAQLGVTS